MWRGTAHIYVTRGRNVPNATLSSEIFSAFSYLISKDVLQGKKLRTNIYAVQQDTQRFFVSCWTAHILQDDTRSLQYQT